MSLRGVVSETEVLGSSPDLDHSHSRRRKLISKPYTLWGSHALTNSSEFRHAKDVKTLELRVMN